MADSSAKPQRNVVVAIDGSKHADYALDFYVKHIHKHNDHVILAYVPELNELLQSTSWEPSVYKFERTVLESALEAEEKRIHDDLEKFAAKLKENKMGGKVRSIVAKNAGEGIIIAIEEEKADLAVVGCRGMGKLRRTFMVYIKQFYRENDHIVLAYVPELNELVHASTWEASVYRFERAILESSLQEQEKRIREDLETFAAKLKEYNKGGKVRSIVAKNAGEGIIKAVEEENAELVVVGCRGKGTLRRTFMGSVSDYIVHHSDVPVLVVRHEDDKHHHHEHKH